MLQLPAGQRQDPYTAHHVTVMRFWRFCLVYQSSRSNHAQDNEGKAPQKGHDSGT
jgi:hypothetical protein